jgi:UPF0042 nucleotide-binding protein
VSRSAKPSRSIDIVVVTGMSGSGKSTAIDALEDEGYYCIDNLPAKLVPTFVELCAAGSAPGLSRVGLGLDLRDVTYVEQWPGVRGELETAGHSVFTIFLDADDDVLLRRFSETRRAHPLGEGHTLPEAVAAERRALAPLREHTSLLLDTSSLTPHEVKRRVRELVSDQAESDGPSITLKSFGHKYGITTDADMVFDVRFLPNPHFVDELRPLTGLDPRVAEYVLGREETREFLTRAEQLLAYLLPHFDREGRSYLTIAIGCTGGRHRSVAITEALAAKLSESGLSVIVRHRDAERD